MPMGLPAEPQLKFSSKTLKTRNKSNQQNEK